jgi:hypothetical protein
MREAPPPPIVPAKRDVVLGGRAVPVVEFRKQFPVLQPFVEATSFEDGASIFPTQEQACRYVFRDSADMRLEVEALNADITSFTHQFPQGSADRILAFSTLGSVIDDPGYIELRLTPVDSTLFDNGSSTG